MLTINYANPVYIKPRTSSRWLDSLIRIILEQPQDIIAKYAKQIKITILKYDKTLSYVWYSRKKTW